MRDPYTCVAAALGTASTGADLLTAAEQAGAVFSSPFLSQPAALAEVIAGAGRRG
jgi:hypothetical protein